MLQFVKFKKLSEKAQSVLKTLCSNYRGDRSVSASFRCSVYYGPEKFIAETRKSMDELKKTGMISSFRIGGEETDEETDLFYFTATADMNLPVEEMAEISVNSQTVFKG